ncbi:MAG: FAD-dependent oxidoreductase [Pseudonocardiaceae bacterium]
MKSTYSDVVVVGAGPAGLVLTKTLSRAGLTVTVVERQTDPTCSPQGALLQPVTLDLLGRLAGMPHSASDPGAVAGIEEVGPHGSIFTGYFDDLDDSPTGYAVNVSQGYLRAFLLDCVRGSPAVTIRTGTTVAGLNDLRPGHCATVVINASEEGEPELIRSSWVVAADGKASMVRELAGIDAEVSGFDHRLFLLSVPMHCDVPRLIRAHRSVGGMVTTVPGGAPGRTLLFVHTSSDGTNVLALAAETVEAIRPFDPVLATAAVGHLPVGRVVDVRPQLVHASSWRRNGVVLLGDSAHGMHNIGGQGLNTAIQDAVVLGRILSGNEGDVVSRLDEHEQARRPYIENLQQAQSRLGSGFWTDGAESWFAPRFEELSLGQREMRASCVVPQHTSSTVNARVGDA